MKCDLFTLALFFLLLPWSNQAQADLIVGLFNTGVDESGNLLPSSTPDPHYSLVSHPLGSGAFATVPDAGTTSTSWVANSRTSQWISSSHNTSDLSGTYIYRLTFNLDGLDPATTEIAGQWATDNFGRIFLNGLDTGLSPTPTGDQDFGHLTAFKLDAGNAKFQSGLNTLDFYVTNTEPGLTGLRVEDLSGTASAVIPEPATFLLAAIGVLSLAGWGWRKRPRLL